MEVVRMTAQETEWKGHPMLEMTNVIDGKEIKISLGLTKLKAVVANIDAVKAFLSKHATAKADTKSLF
jgi:hypothetical protein